MGQKKNNERQRQLIPRSLKYPLFFLGLFIIIVGGLAEIKIGGVSLEVEVATAAVGFVILVLGIALE